jgi:hypothetical protein
VGITSSYKKKGREARKSKSCITFFLKEFLLEIISPQFVRSSPFRPAPKEEVVVD